MIQPQNMKFRLLETYARMGVMDDIKDVPICNHAHIIYKTVCIFNIFIGKKCNFILAHKYCEPPVVAETV